ncbi:MAG: hypothetical protein ACI82H_001735 [Alphaproteobacteria bacterium]|jgi:hypothetical protein
MSEPLKLRVIDEDDLEVLATVLQDALVPVQDMCFLAAENRFVLVANRFCWERLPATSLDSTVGSQQSGSQQAGTDPAGPYERVHCGLTVEHVKKVQTLGFSPTAHDDSEKLFEVLTLQADEGGLNLLFAGGAAVRIEIDRLEILAQDVGEPWPTLWRPEHLFDDADS